MKFNENASDKRIRLPKLISIRCKQKSQMGANQNTLDKISDNITV